MLKAIVEKNLTPRQRFVLIAGAFQGIPLDLIAERLGTNRDNILQKPPRRAEKIEGVPQRAGPHPGGDSVDF